MRSATLWGTEYVTWDFFLPNLTLITPGSSLTSFRTVSRPILHIDARSLSR